MVKIGMKFTPIRVLAPIVPSEFPVRGLRRSRTIPGQVSLSATKVCLETRTLHQPLGLSPRWSQPMVGRRLQAWAEGHQPRCSHEEPHHSLREIQDQPMGWKKPEARALATTVRLEQDGLRYRSRGVMAPAASSETFRRHPWRTWPRAVRKPQEGRQPDVPTTARWVSLLVVGGSSRIPPELMSKGHWAIGRRESPLEKRTPPPSCRVKKLGDMASKEIFGNSARLMAQQIVGLMEEPW